jgi:predicted DNA-binding protein (MmcQ/YjbR family)
MPDLDSIRALCRSFPDATQDMPWPDDLCFKIRGKIFASIVLSDGRYPRITLKVPPESFHDLCEIEGIAPAAYVGRYNFVTLANPNVLPARELEDLIRQSYELVEAKAPGKAATKRKPAKKSGGKSSRPRRR